MTKRNRTKEEWVELVKQQQASGLPVKTWCEQSGINIYAMADAKSRLRKLELLPPPEKRTNEKWLELVSQQRASGLTLETWCNENGIKLPTMADRISRLRKMGLITEPKPNKGGKPRKGERRPTTELRKYEQLQTTQWMEVTPFSFPVSAPKTKDICVRIGEFEIVVPDNFADETFMRVCKLLSGKII